MLFFYLITLAFIVHTYGDEIPKPGFFTQAELLYLQAEENGLSYAVESSSSSHLSHARAKNLDFEWDFGFNVGIGYRISHDRWRLLLQFTSLQTHADAHHKVEDGKIFYPIWLADATLSRLFADEVKAHWRLHLGLVDFVLSKPYLETQTLTLTPQIGIRWGSVRQKFNIAYHGGNFPKDENPLVRMKNKFEGLGPTLGLMGDYAFGKGWSLFARGSASLLYGEFYLHQDEDTLGSKEKLLGLHSIFRDVSPIIEGEAGVSWQHQFKGSLKQLTFRLAWDQFLLFSQNQLVRFVATPQPGVIAANQGDLSIAGVNFNAAFDF